MRLSSYLKNEFTIAARKAFGDCTIILFGSRVDDSKRGGDFDIAIKTDMSHNDFRQAKVQFMKHLLLKDLDLPIDLVQYRVVSDLFQREIDKGVQI